MKLHDYLLLRKKIYHLKLFKTCYKNNTVLLLRELLLDIYQLFTDKDIDIINAVVTQNGEQTHTYTKDLLPLKTNDCESWKLFVNEHLLLDESLYEAIIQQIIKLLYSLIKSEMKNYLNEASKMQSNHLSNSIFANDINNINNHEVALYKDRINHLQKLLKLTAKEKRILEFFYFASIDYYTEFFYTQNEFKMSNIKMQFNLLKEFFELSDLEAQKIFDENLSMLFQSDILFLDNNGCILFHRNVSLYLSGLTDECINQSYLKKSEYTKLDANFKNCKNITNFKIQNIDLLSLQQLLNPKISSPASSKKGQNIIIHGNTGTGKSELVYALAKYFKLNFYSALPSESLLKDMHFRRKALSVAQYWIDSSHSFILVDHAEELLSIKNNMYSSFVNFEQLAWVNNYLDSSKQNIIWIVRDLSGLDDSTKRRFSFSLNIDENFNINNNNHNHNYNHNSHSCNNYDTDDIQIDSNIIKNQKLLLSQKIFNNYSSKGISNTKFYNIDALNTDFPPSKILNLINKFFQSNQEISFISNNLSILLHGPSGSGKTEFVKHIAQQLQVDLIEMRASDLRSKYIGETEFNIAKIFQTASEKKSILFFDEADSFFKERRDNHYVYSKDETNELLQQMENFKGILIASTNLLEDIDVAALRRFTIKIKFDYLSNEAKQSLFYSYFSDIPIIKDKLNSDLLFKQKITSSLDSIDRVTPGDFKVLYNNYLLDKYSASILDNENNFLDEILNDLKLETSYKNKLNLHKIKLI